MTLVSVNFCRFVSLSQPSSRDLDYPLMDAQYLTKCIKKKPVEQIHVGNTILWHRRVSYSEQLTIFGIFGSEAAKTFGNYFLDIKKQYNC